MSVVRRLENFGKFDVHGIMGNGFVISLSHGVTTSQLNPLALCCKHLYASCLSDCASRL